MNAEVFMRYFMTLKLYIEVGEAVRCEHDYISVLGIPTSEQVIKIYPKKHKISTLNHKNLMLNHKKLTLNHKKSHLNHKKSTLITMFVGIRNCVFVQKILGESGQLNNT